jgi:hypothetical protein
VKLEVLVLQGSREFVAYLALLECKAHQVYQVLKGHQGIMASQESQGCMVNKE